MSYQMAATVVTLNGLEGHSPLADLIEMQSVEHLCSILRDFNRQCDSFSALAELLVNL